MALPIPKSLNEAREQIGALAALIATQDAKIAAYESIPDLATAGIVRVDDDSGVHFSVPRLAELESQCSNLTQTVAQLEAEKAVLIADVQKQTEAAMEAMARVKELELFSKTKEQLARELLADRGGAPLNVDPSDTALTTPAQIRARFDALKTENERIAFYREHSKELKASAMAMATK